VITSKAANGYHFKTGQWKVSERMKVLLDELLRLLDERQLLAALF